MKARLRLGILSRRVRTISELETLMWFERDWEFMGPSGIPRDSQDMGRESRGTIGNAQSFPWESLGLKSHVSHRIGRFAR